MEKKKSTKASMKGMNTLYFLIGLNLVLVGVWYLFGMQSFNSNSTEFAEAKKLPPSSSSVYQIELPKPEKTVEELPVEPLPQPEVPMDLVEMPDPIEKPVKFDEPTKIPLPVVSGKRDKPISVDLHILSQKAEEVNETVLEPMSAIEVSEMAVYPGCEKYSKKADLVNCFSKELSKDIIRELDTEFPDVDKDLVGVQLGFNVNTNGEIVDIKPLRGDKAFKEQATNALEKVASRLRRKGKLIKPAKMNTGDKAILKFQNTVKLQRP